MERRYGYGSGYGMDYEEEEYGYGELEYLRDQFENFEESHKTPKKSFYTKTQNEPKHQSKKRPSKKNF